MHHQTPEISNSTSLSFSKKLATYEHYLQCIMSIKHMKVFYKLRSHMIVIIEVV